MEHKVVIENPKGSYKSFDIEGDPIWKDYPLSGVTYPVDYGYLGGYIGEDGHDLDIFKGSGDLNGYIKIWRCDVPIETKVVMNVTQDEWNEITKIFAPVIKEQKLFDNKADFQKLLVQYKN